MKQRVAGHVLLAVFAAIVLAIPAASAQEQQTVTSVPIRDFLSAAVGEPVQGGGSLLVAVLAYLMMQFPLIGHLTFNFPELNLVFLALIMLMGQYTGYKFSELRRFRAMVENNIVDDKAGGTK